MLVYIVTAFPEMMEASLNVSMFRKASQNNLVQYIVWDLRDFTKDKHRQIDDTPYGGGPGMVIKPEPFFRAFYKIKKELGSSKFRVIFPTPAGKTFCHRYSVELSKESVLVFFCGHYKGVDERVIQKLVTDEISIGDYVVTGGELPSLLIIDSVIRHVPGVLHSYESAETDSFSDDLLEGPQYTRPQSYRSMTVPEVLLSGNHAQIAEWRYKQRLSRTRERRNDLYNKLTEKHEVGGSNG